MAKRPVTEDGEEVKVPHITEFPDLVDVIPDLAEESRKLSEAIAKMEARKKEINTEIGTLLEASEVKSVRGDSWVAVRVDGGYSEKLSPEILLQKGVKMEVIEEATIKVPRAGYTQVRALHGGTR